MFSLRNLRTPQLLILCILMLTALALTGCGGGGGSSSTGTALMEPTRAMTASAVQDNLPVADATLATIDAQTETASEDLLVEDDSALTRGAGVASWNCGNLHFEKTTEGDLNANTF